MLSSGDWNTSQSELVSIKGNDGDRSAEDHNRGPADGGGKRERLRDEAVWIRSLR